MSDLNQFCATGLVKDAPALRYTAQGRALTAATLTVTRATPDGPRTTAVFLSIWGELAERFAQTVSAGQYIAVAGELRNRKIEREDGPPAWRTEIHVSAFTALGGDGPPAASPSLPPRAPREAVFACR